MQKFMSFFIIVQLLVYSAYGLLFFNSYILSSVLNSNTSSLRLVFYNGQEHASFLRILEEEELDAKTVVFIDNQNLLIYTSDLSLSNRVDLTSGRWPLEGLTEFVSTTETGETGQVGTIGNIIPNFNVSIMRLKNTTNINITSGGIYTINTTDRLILDNLVYRLNENIYEAEIISINNEVSVFANIDLVEIIEFVSISLLMFLGAIALIINFAIKRLNFCSVFVIHGYSKLSIAKILTIDLLKSLLISFFISYILLILYLLVAGYSIYLVLLSIYFSIISITLFSIYIVTINAFTLFYLNITNAISLLKGKRPYLFIQLINVILKVAFTVAILVFGHLSIDNFMQLRGRMQSYSSWNLTQNLHSTRIYNVGQLSNFDIRFDIDNRNVGLFESLSQDNQAFIMCAINILFLDLGAMPYHDMTSAPPLQISPHGYRVTVSPNFFKFNPIYSLEGFPVEQLLVYDDYVLNILVPESLATYEDDIIRLYLQEFYFSKVGIDNIYNNELGLEINQTSIQDLSINLIYVQNNQSYFTFNHEIRPYDGNYVYDPIAVVFTGSLGISRLSTFIGNGLFFYTDAIDPHADILPLLVEHNLAHVIRGTNAIFDENSQSLITLRNQVIRTIGFIVILIVASFNVTLIFVSSYFEKNKLKIFIKSILGYGSVNRNIYFGLINTLHIILCMAIVSLLFGSGRLVIMVGFFIIVIDIIFLSILDTKLKRQTLAKKLKGET